MFNLNSNDKKSEIMSRDVIGSVYSQGDFYFINLGLVEMNGYPKYGKQSNYVLNYQISPYINHWIMIPRDMFKHSIKHCSEEELFNYIKLIIKENMLIKQKAVDVNDNLYAVYNIIDGISYLVYEFTGKAKYITKFNLENKSLYVNVGDYVLSFKLNKYFNGSRE